jgi:hypothetical protein
MEHKEVLSKIFKQLLITRKVLQKHNCKKASYSSSFLVDVGEKILKFNISHN